MTSSQSGDWWGTSQEEGEEPRVVVRDRRRIDPDSGEVRPETGAATGGAAGGDATESRLAADPADLELIESLRLQAAERTADLQRLKAEFDNYRRRVERDRQQIGEQATAKVLTSLLSVLDDLGRARDHGDLEGPFKAIAEALETALEAAGLERYGVAGDEFDPSVHEALMHSYRSDVSGPTCVDIFRAGYLHAGRVLRPAQVSVAEPSGEPAESVEPAVAAPGPVPDDTGTIPGPDHGGPTVSAG
ncbi:nucleotide exchange factor GrpE [Frankia sp. R82]|uniref:nucleotide exchange factor GrpE n=1 Tax=Frankia sp. R82 TaxID=2950553 RepID=UPI00204360FD|nr:nucleotide exchange factor GrpE [Frankia sp. R82]MCM3882397.1 nucleotide exchange factor GrpE [Frankia sp. R82]